MIKTAIPFNVNDTIRIRLTKSGREFLRKNSQTWKLTPGYSTAEKDDGWCEWQLWQVMATFGPVMHIGFDPPFETTIELLVEELHS